MGCNCGTRAAKLLKRLGWVFTPRQWTHPLGRVWLAPSFVEQHHFAAVLIGVIEWMTRLGRRSA